jgi:hypothetical protein
MTEVQDRLRKALADRYTIERELGSGGMATVYLAEDLKHHRGEPNLFVEFDDDQISGTFWFSFGPDHLYVTIAEHESDIWVMDVDVER